MRKPSLRTMGMLLLAFLFVNFILGIGGAVGGFLAILLLFAVSAIFKIELNDYYVDGKKTTKEKWEKLPNKVDYGFTLKLWPSGGSKMMKAVLVFLYVVIGLVVLSMFFK